MRQVDFFYQYLMNFHRLPMEDLGEIVLNKKSATLYVLDKKIEPPAFYLTHSLNSSNAHPFISWLAGRSSVSYEEAKIAITTYINYIKEILHKEGKMVWDQLGEWIMDDAGQIVFKGLDIDVYVPIAIPAEKLIRGSQAHEVLVGDRTYSGEQVQQLLEKNKKQAKSNTKNAVSSGFVVAAILVIMISFIMIPGFKQLHQRQIKLSPQRPIETYTIIKAN
jgi:hypothetical protein